MGYNIQDTILGKLREERKPVAIFTTNGYQMKGLVLAYDQNVVVLNDSGKQQIIFKSAISTIVPEAPVEIEN